MVQIKQVGVIGAGQMGTGIAHVCALGGYDVLLHDVSAAVWTSTGTVIQEHAPTVPYKSIICAVDETPESEAVVRAAAAMAKSYDASLALVHVLEMPPPAPEIDFTPYRQDVIDAGHAHMRGLKERMNIDVPDIVIDAGVSNGIREEIVRRKADLLVVGRGHDQGIVSRIWSRLYSIVRDSPCPVLSV